MSTSKRLVKELSTYDTNLKLKPTRTPTIRGFYNSVSVEKLFVQDGNLMVLVHYGGGCKRHQFQIIIDPELSKQQTENKGTKSLVLKILHNSGGDTCQAIKGCVLRIDITSFSKRGYKRFVVQ